MIHVSTGNKMLSNIQEIPVISVIYGLSLQLLYGKLKKSLKCQKNVVRLLLHFCVSCLCIIEQ
jgi:hypothetical protein